MPAGFKKPGFKQAGSVKIASGVDRVWPNSPPTRENRFNEARV